MNFEIHFLLSHGQLFFVCVIHLEENVNENDCKIVKIMLPDFCPLKLEIARFSIKFHLKRSLRNTPGKCATDQQQDLL